MYVYSLICKLSATYNFCIYEASPKVSKFSKLWSSISWLVQQNHNHLGSSIHFYDRLSLMSTTVALPILFNLSLLPESCSRFFHLYLTKQHIKPVSNKGAH